VNPPASNQPSILVLAGPTAVGKSEIALLLAEKVGGEIVSVDSMQVYRGMDIGTAKPSVEERERVRHHLLDVVEITEPFDAARFVRLAGTAVVEIRSRGRFPVLCGGTGLYFKALLEGLGEAAPADPKLRAELESLPLVELLRELKEHDPVTYQQIDQQNPRRVVRAVEVLRVTGKPYSEQRAKWKKPGSEGLGFPAGTSSLASEKPKLLLGFSRVAEDLRRRIDARVEAMFRDGLVDETRQLLEHGLAENRTAMQALGYRQVVEHLRGEHGLPETIELVKVRTRQFAKRQMTWFRRQMKLEWIELAAGQAATPVVEQLAKQVLDV
jgi:tRNA dimethylallyltransferase